MVKPTHATPNITHQSVVMLCSGPECGVRTFWPDDPVTRPHYPKSASVTAPASP